MPQHRGKENKKLKCDVIKSNGKKCNKTLTFNGQCPEHGPWK